MHFSCRYASLVLRHRSLSRAGCLELQCCEHGPNATVHLALQDSDAFLISDLQMFDLKAADGNVHVSLLNSHFSSVIVQVSILQSG